MKRYCEKHLIIELTIRIYYEYVIEIRSYHAFLEKKSFQFLEKFMIK